MLTAHLNSNNLQFFYLENAVAVPSDCEKEKLVLNNIVQSDNNHLMPFAMIRRKINCLVEMTKTV